jgi:hypothetical protein
VELTAATERLPEYWPTTTRSAAWNRRLRKDVRIKGTEKEMMWESNGPSVMLRYCFFMKTTAFTGIIAFS